VLVNCKLFVGVGAFGKRKAGPEPGFKIFGKKHIFRGVKFLFILYVEKKFFWAQQNLRGTKKFGSTVVECLRGYGPDGKWILFAQFSVASGILCFVAVVFQFFDTFFCVSNSFLCFKQHSFLCFKQFSTINCNWRLLINFWQVFALFFSVSYVFFLFCHW